LDKLNPENEFIKGDSSRLASNELLMLSKVLNRSRVVIIDIVRQSRLMRPQSIVMQPQKPWPLWCPSFWLKLETFFIKKTDFLYKTL